MTYEIDCFMWTHQEHFHTNWELDAQHLFRKLDPDFKVRLLMVGFLKEDLDDRKQICPVPDNSPLQPDVYSGVLAEADEIEKTHPRYGNLHGDAGVEDRVNGGIKRWALAKAVENRIESEAGQGQRTFAGSPVRLHGYDVVVALQVDDETCTTYYEIPRDRLMHTEYDEEYGVMQSLVEATAWEFLDECCNAMKRDSQESPGTYFGTGTHHNDILVRSGRRLLDAAAIAGLSLIHI